jgi:hypothetical protein
MCELLHRVDLEARLLVRAEPLGQVERLCRRLVKKTRLVDGVPKLDIDPTCGGAINTVLVKKGVTVGNCVA